MSLRQALALCIGIVSLLVCGLLAHGPITQLAHYHAFADQRSWLGLPHAADVLSNAGFVVAGLFGLREVARRQYRCTHGYLLFCISLVLTAMGSAYYHLAPDDTRQVWDRLPIALACVALLLDAWEAGSGRQHMPSTLVSMGVAVASVAWWWYGNQSGNGDLRPYLLLQVLPLLLVPLLQWAFRRPVVERCAFAVAIACYVAAKMLELADHAVLQALAVVSGHTLKHVFASIGAAIIIVFRRPSEMKSPL